MLEYMKLGDQQDVCEGWSRRPRRPSDFYWTNYQILVFYKYIRVMIMYLLGRVLLYSVIPIDMSKIDLPLKEFRHL
jgi:hypothetical protein